MKSKKNERVIAVLTAAFLSVGTVGWMSASDISADKPGANTLLDRKESGFKLDKERKAIVEAFIQNNLSYLYSNDNYELVDGRSKVFLKYLELRNKYRSNELEKASETKDKYKNLKYDFKYKGVESRSDRTALVSVDVTLSFNYNGDKDESAVNSEYKVLLHESKGIWKVWSASPGDSIDNPFDSVKNIDILKISGNPDELKDGEQPKDADLHIKALEELYKKYAGEENNHNIRIACADRIATSIAVSEKFFKKADSVIIASGRNNADALVAAGYADKLKAPILLAGKNGLSMDVLKEIKRLNAKNATIIGGERSVSKEAISQLDKEGLKSVRISGNDRYETSLKLAEACKAIGMSSDKVVIINGFKNADALSIATMTTAKGIPVIMTNGKSLNEASAKLLKEFKASEVIIVGGDKSMNPSIEKDLKGYKVLRIAGADRYETSVKIAKEVYEKIDAAIIANAYNSVDALSAGAVSGIAKAPILLVSENHIPKVVKEAIKMMKKDKAIVVGGEKTISNKVIEDI